MTTALKRITEDRMHGRKLVRFYPKGQDCFSIHQITGWGECVETMQQTYHLSGVTGPVHASRIAEATEDDIREYANRLLPPLTRKAACN